MKPGIYFGLAMDDYLAIKAVSAGVIRTIIDECPRAARFASHLDEDEEEVDEQGKQRRERGSVAHSVFLEGSEACVEVIDPTDHPNTSGGGFASGWTNKSIKAAREAARSAGKIPMLAGAMFDVRAMVDEARAFVESLRELEPAVWSSFQPDGGQSELTMVWQEGETLCKLRADRISNDYGVLVNYKTTATSVEPSRFSRAQLIGSGYYVDAAWYRRGVRALTGVDPTHLFLAQQVDRPFLCSLPGLDPSWNALGDEKVTEGLRMWQECVRSGVWPGYPSRAVYPELPAFERAKWDELNGVDDDGLPSVEALFPKGRK